MKAKTKVSRLFVILLALVMVVGLLPTTALAAEPATGTADFTKMIPQRHWLCSTPRKQAQRTVRGTVAQAPSPSMA